MKPRHDLYATVTDQLIAAIEAGAGTWNMPWHLSSAPIMRPTSVAGRRYNGINRLILWATADACGYSSGIFGTYQQWKGNGAQVRKGETGTHVILWKKVERQDGAAPIGNPGDGEGDSRARFFARSFVVFNRDQVDGADDGAIKEATPIATPIVDALTFLESLDIPVEYGPHDAYYRPDLDKVFLPQRIDFDSDLDLVSTLAHEMVHATGHPSRLSRETLRDYHKDRAIRSREELCAEIGSAMIMADLGLACTPRPDHAAYLSSWLSVLRHDTRAIFAAAAQAQAAADWIHAAAAKAGSVRADEGAITEPPADLALAA